MSKINKRLFYLVPLIIILASLMVLAACSSASSTTSTTGLATTTTRATTTTGAATASTSTSKAATTTTGAGATATTGASSQTVTIDLTAQNMAFDKSTITVPAGASVTINFTNKDNVPHNFAAYTDSGAQTSIYVGKVITNSTATYTFTAPSTPGSYFFRCDVHPTVMTGTLVVQ